MLADSRESYTVCRKKLTGIISRFQFFQTGFRKTDRNRQQIPAAVTASTGVTLCARGDVYHVFSARFAWGNRFRFCFSQSRRPVDDTGAAGRRMRASFIKTRHILVMLENILADLLE